MGTWIAVTIAIAVVSYVIGEFNGRVHEREKRESNA